MRMKIILQYFESTVEFLDQAMEIATCITLFPANYLTLDTMIGVEHHCSVIKFQGGLITRYLIQVIYS